MKINVAIPSILHFSLEKWRWIITCFVLLSGFILMRLGAHSKWFFLNYNLAFCLWLIWSSFCCRLYFDELHQRKKNLLQAFMQSREMFIPLSLYLLALMSLTFCLVGVENLANVIAYLPFLQGITKPLVDSLFFLVKFIEVIISTFWGVSLFVLIPLIAFRLSEWATWPQYLMQRIAKQNKQFFQGFILAVLPLGIVGIFLYFAIGKMPVIGVTFPILLLSSAMLAPCLHFFIACSCLFHLQFTFMMEKSQPEE